MAYRIPSSRRRKKEVKAPNLIPILDAVFIFIFFLLMSASFLKIYEIPSDVPTISEEAPPEDKKPFVLTLKIDANEITIHEGLEDKEIGSFPRVNDKFDLSALHQFLVQKKKSNLKENTIIFEPIANPTYEEIVQIMDAVRTLRKGDPDLNKGSKELFSNIIFGNIQS